MMKLFTRKLERSNHRVMVIEEDKLWLWLKLHEQQLFSPWRMKLACFAKLYGRPRIQFPADARNGSFCITLLIHLHSFEGIPCPQSNFGLTGKPRVCARRGILIIVKYPFTFISGRCPSIDFLRLGDILTTSLFKMVAMALNSCLGKEPFFIATLFQRQTVFRSRLPRINVQELTNKPNSFTHFKVFCVNGQGNAIASNMTKKEEVLKRARLDFSEEVAFKKQDQEISVVKALLLISAEDEAFVSLNREKDRLAAHTEGRNFPVSQTDSCGDGVDGFLIAGRTMPLWLARFDFLAKEVEDLLISKGSSLKPVEVFEAVGTVLFKIQGFKRAVADLDTKSFYLHFVLTLGSGSGMLLCIIYMEVCRRLGVSIRGAEVGDDLLMWPLIENLQECFEHYDGDRSWFLELLAFYHPSHLFGSNFGPSTHGSLASPILKFASNKEIVGMVLSKLKNLHWKDACKARPGYALTDPLHPLALEKGNSVDNNELAVGALLRPRNLSLAVMASERLRLLHPHSWALMRDHGLLLYHSRRYGEAVQELSICAALAPTVERQMLEHFVEKLHLLHIESSWSSWKSPNAPSTLA
ncbi:hypothetical protein GOP47_0004062 [Adiantum capillus-veneris]|uniref:Protein SirB1 N-terminal domain-containing protein n=1 Tax=Adiantum capillus-veneris TaxID=13818 RepID=A0A9D4V6W0_ADICA|nr:hypothetical protein GOP47_0004062 [Adiantum capillus-veneris]